MKSKFFFAVLFFALISDVFGVENGTAISFMGGELSVDEDLDAETIYFSLKKSGGETLAKLHSCEAEGGPPRVAWVDKVEGVKNYISITCSWNVRHRGLGISGEYYQTRVYTDKVTQDGYLEEKEKFDKQLGGFEGSDESGYSRFFYNEKDLFSQKLALITKGMPDNLPLVWGILKSRFDIHDKEAIADYARAVDLKILINDWSVDKANVTKFNDVGFYLCESSVPDVGLLALHKVENIDPSRVVLQLNIADCLWQQRLVDKSKNYYKKYHDLMVEKGKASGIPVRVKERLSTK